MYHYDDDALYEDGECIEDGGIIQIMGAVSSGFLARIYSEEWVAARFGRNHKSVLIPTERLAAHVDMLFTPPAIDLGITFSPFQFPEDVEAADSFEEILSDVCVMDQRFEFYYEGSDSVPQAWLDNYLDTALAARFIPLIRNSQGDLLFHGPHFFTLLDYLALNASFARILSQPGGTNHKELSIHYSSAQ